MIAISRRRYNVHMAGPDKFDILARDLERLRTGSPPPGMFGEEAHRYRLNKRLNEEKVAQFEREHHVLLPQDYRQFLVRIGNGGAGPYYGMFKFQHMDDHDTWSDFVGDLTAPFPHTQAWNLPHPEKQADDDETYEREYAEYERRYFDPHVMDGAIPICHLGCAIRHWLVISGSEAGNIWVEDRASDNGVYPLQTETRERVTFFDWYRDWVDEALAELSANQQKHAVERRKQFWMIAGVMGLVCVATPFFLPRHGPRFRSE